MKALSDLTFYCALCNVRHVLNYRCAAVRSRNPIERIELAYPGVMVALSDSTRQIKAVR